MWSTKEKWLLALLNSAHLKVQGDSGYYSDIHSGYFCDQWTWNICSSLSIASGVTVIVKLRKRENREMTTMTYDDKSGSPTHKGVGEPDYTMIFITWWHDMMFRWHNMMTLFDITWQGWQLSPRTHEAKHLLPTGSVTFHIFHDHWSCTMYIVHWVFGYIPGAGKGKVRKDAGKVVQGKGGWR